MPRGAQDTHPHTQAVTVFRYKVRDDAGQLTVQKISGEMQV